LPTGGLQPQAGRYLGWILFSFFLHFILIPLALNHLARLEVAGLLGAELFLSLRKETLVNVIIKVFEVTFYQL